MIAEGVVHPAPGPAVTQTKLTTDFLGLAGAGPEWASAIFSR